MRLNYLHIFSALTIALVLSACNKPDPTVIPGVEPDDELAETGTPVTKVTATIEDIVFDEGTKTTAYLGNGQMIYSWDEGDLVGFFPSSSDVKFGNPSQARFIYTSPATASSPAVLDACGWSLIRGKRYYSYYPYNSAAAYNNVPISFRFQRQIETRSTAHLGACDYLHSSVVPQSQGDIAVSYSHVASVAHFILTVPEGYRNSRFTDMELSTSGSYITAAAVLNPSGTTPSISSRTNSDSFSVSLGEINSDMACPADGILDIYCMMCPGGNWGGHPVTVTLYSRDDEFFSGTFTPSANMQAGTAYNYNVQLAFAGQGRVNLSRNETANCYIVSAAGDYKFKATKGCTDISVNPASVKILWETVNTNSAPATNSLIKNDLTISNGYVLFSTADTFREGNALIAAYSGPNGTGDILWSWHIWMTDAPADVTYPNDAGIMQDRNLGALATTGNLSNGLFYQWGRKDPMMGAINSSSATYMSIAGTASSLTSVTSSTGTIDYATKHPTEFLGADGGTNLDWIYANYRVGTHWQLANPNEEYSLWYAADEGKTKYDPCPPGYRVPYSGTNGIEKDIWGQALNISTKLTGTSSGFSINGHTLTFQSNVGLTMNFSNGASAFYPTTGYVSEGGTRVNDGLHFMCWSNFPGGSGNSNEWNTQYSACLDGNMERTTIAPHYNSGRAAGKSVRCMKSTSQMIPESSTNNEGFGNSPAPTPW